MSQPDPGQDDLQTRLRAGDPQALAELFDAHRQRLWRMANFRMDERLRGRVSPDDIVQETYLAAASRIRHYAEMATASPFVWVRMVMHQTLIDVRRRHLGAKMRDAARDVSLNRRRHTQTTVASLAIHLVGDFTSPSAAAGRAELLDRVRGAIEGMDPIDREILALRHFEELTNTEVAEDLDIQPKAASIRYVRALQRLRAILSGVGGLFDEEADA